jgi:hypothetical protein
MLLTLLNINLLLTLLNNGLLLSCVINIGLRAVELLIYYTIYILKLARWLDAVKAVGLYRRSVRR